jgi:hypothetical protein
LLLVGGELLGGVEGQVVIVLLLVEVLLELVVGEFLLLVPVAQLGLGGEAVGDVVVVH